MEGISDKHDLTACCLQNRMSSKAVERAFIAITGLLIARSRKGHDKGLGSRPTDSRRVRCNEQGMREKLAESQEILGLA